MKHTIGSVVLPLLHEVYADAFGDEIGMMNKFHCRLVFSPKYHVMSGIVIFGDTKRRFLIYTLYINIYSTRHKMTSL